MRECAMGRCKVYKKKAAHPMGELLINKYLDNYLVESRITVASG